MKANEFLNEYVTAPAQGSAASAGPTSMKQAAAANRQLLKRGILQRNPEIANTIDAVTGTAQAIKNKWQGLKSNAINKAALNQQAAKFSDTWDQYAGQLQLPPNDLNAYKTALDDWLGKTLKVNLDRAALDRYVTSTKPGSTDRYFTDYFIPHYTQYQKQAAAGGAQSAQQPAQPAQPAAAANSDIKQALTDLDNYIEQGGTVTPKQRGEFQSIWKLMGGTQIAESKVNRRIGLYEGLTPREGKAAFLWESAGRQLVEADLTAQQISNIFAAVQQGATASGSNRTMLGKGKDAAGAVSNAWEDLKSKISSSGPIQNMDAKFDSAADKLKQATGGDAGAMKYVQKYRDFAQKHPVAQSFLYAALIAAAGLSGAGLGGAAALGLFKMTDKLLQGEKFSSAAYSGAKTGAAAGVASGVLGSGDANAATDAVAGGPKLVNPQDIIQQIQSGQITNQNDLVAALGDAKNKSSAWKIIQQAANMPGSNEIDKIIQSIAGTTGLKESQIRLIFRRVERRELAEGLMDTVKQAAGKASEWVRTKGENLTTKVTADKLQQAWKAAGSPMDSEAVAQIIRDAGVSNDIVDNVFQSLSIPLNGQPAAGSMPTADVTTAQTVKLDKTLSTIRSYIEGGGSITPAMRNTFTTLWKKMGGTQIAERAR